ncbi:MAG: DUF3179 domain-containing (seleno)protein, partial [Chloroflexota bacterium]
MRRLPVLLPALALVTVACTGTAGTPRQSSPAAPVARPTSGAPDDGLRVTTAGWSTDFTQHDVPLDEIIGGGPGKDGIPAIDEPKFLPVDRVDWLVEREPVIAVGIGDDWRAYP